MEKCAPDLRQPTLMIDYTGDNSTFPAETEQLIGWIGATNKERHRVHGNHHGQAIRAGMPSGQLESGRIIRDWLARNQFV